MLRRGDSKGLSTMGFFRKEPTMVERGNKKGLSTIVATLLIILLTLVAVGVIWIVVRNVIQSGSEQISLGKFTLNLEIKNVEIDAIGNSINVRITRNAGEGDISGLDFIVEDGENTEVVKVNSSLQELETRTFQLPLVSTNASGLKKVSVAPIFKLSSGKEVVGDVKDEYTFSTSSGGTIGACVDTCTSLGYTCGTQTVCGASTNCGTCSTGYVCSGTSCVQQSNCTDTCNSLNYNCGYHSVCGTNSSCGSCSGGQVCNATGRCATVCTDTCTSLGYTCGTQTVCGVSTNCGICSSGTCNSTGQCVVTCTDTCTSLGYTCGTQTVCGVSTNCGICSSGTCSSGHCIVSSTLVWKSDLTVNTSLPDVGDYSTPSVFYKDSSWYLISGENNGGFFGYVWSGTQWVSNTTINNVDQSTSGLSAPTVFHKDSSWYMIAGKWNGLHMGYAWSGTQWVSNTTIVVGLPNVSEVTYYSTPSVFYKDSSWYMISGENSGVFFGYAWNGTQWKVNTTIIAGLPDIGGKSSPSVFHKDSSWYLIAGNNSGLFNGYVWSGTQWVFNTTIIAGLPDIGSWSAPIVFYKDSSWEMISGEISGTFYGFKY
jgi:hypothetical protein